MSCAFQSRWLWKSKRIITVQPKRQGQPSKNISVLVDLLFVCLADENSVTFCTLNISQWPSLAEAILSTDEAICAPVHLDILSKSGLLTFRTNEISFEKSSWAEDEALFSTSTTLGRRDSIFPTTIFRCSFSCIKGILFISRNIASKISSKSIIRHIPVQESCQWMPHIQHNKTKFVDLGSALLGAASN